MKYVLGCDVGGTDIKYGILTQEGELLERRRAKTPALVDEAAYQVVLDNFAQLIADHGVSKDDIIGFGLDTPGAILADGTQALTHNLEINIAGLRSAIERAYPGIATAVLNDANAAALGEMWQGSAKGADNYVQFALGTGVGAGVVVGGKVVSGARGCGGETGHMTVKPDETRSCGCGRKGCIEQYASATGIVKNYLLECEARGEEPVDTSDGAITVFRALDAGSESAQATIDLFCDMFALCLSNTATVTDPQMFVIGGGVAQSFTVFAEKLRERFRHYALPTMQNMPIEEALLGSAAQIYGAAHASLQAGGNA